MNFTIYLPLLLISIMLLHCSVFVYNPESDLISEQFCWIHFASVILAIGIILMEFPKSKSKITFSLPDLLLILLYGIVLISCKTEQCQIPNRFLFISQLITLWFMLRVLLQVHKELLLFFNLIMIFTSILIAYYLFFCTDTTSIFYLATNKASLSAIKINLYLDYIAVIYPICLNMSLHNLNCNKFRNWNTSTCLFYFSTLGTCTTVMIVLSYTHHPLWIITTIASLWIVWERYKHKINVIKSLPKKYLSIIIGAIFILVIIISIQLIHSKMNTSSFIERVLSMNFIYPNKECWIISTEFKMGGLFLFFSWIISSVYYGIKHRQTAAVYSILIMCIISLYKNPFQQPYFWVLLIFLIIICITQPEKPLKEKGYPYIGILSAIVSCFLFYGQIDDFNYYRKWLESQKLQSVISLKK